MKTLVIVESPKKAKEIQKYLGKDYFVEACYGHIFDLPKFSGLGVSLKDFRPQYNLMEDKKQVLYKLQNLAKNVDMILVASDPDREGEAIAFHLKEVLESFNKPIKRAKFHEISEKKVKQAISNPEELDVNLYEAQQARRSLDRLVGFLASPIVMQELKDNHLSAGRVQSVALRMIVDREIEIENFKPEEYWNITAELSKFSKPEEHFTAKLVEKVLNKDRAEEVKKDLEKALFLVSQIDKETKPRLPPAPFTTPDLLQSASTRLKFNSVYTMQLAQKLYESGYITYMRTDSVNISNEALQEIRDYLKQNSLPYPTKANVYKSKGSAQEAHECIRPTNPFNTHDKLFVSPDEAKLYQLIWQRTLASQMIPALYDTCVVSIIAGKHLLKAHGSMLKEAGWMQIYGSVEKESKKDIQLPVLKVGEKLQLVPPKVKTQQLFTKPPSRFSEASLVKELKDQGIGRPSTYASITNKIKDRGYVEQKEQIYSPSDLGRQVCQLLQQYFEFMKYEYTAEMELKLDQVEEGKLLFFPMMKSFYDNFSAELKKAQAKNLVNGINCYKCGSGMILANGPYGKYYKCSSTGCKGTKKFTEPS